MTEQQTLPKGPWSIFSRGINQFRNNVEICHGVNRYQDGPEGKVCELKTSFNGLPELVESIPDILDLLRQWQVAEETGDAVEMNNARAARNKLLQRIGEVAHD